MTRAQQAETIRAQQAQIAELQAEVDAERRHHGIRNASAVRTLVALGYSWHGTDAWQPPAPQAVQAAVPLPLLVRDIARDLGITVLEACIALKPQGNYSTNSGVTAEMARMLRDLFPAPAHPAEGVPAQTINERVAFDDFFRQRNGLHPDTDTTFRSDAAEPWKYWNARAALATTQPAAQGMDAQDAECLEIGRELNRACAELHWGYEIILYLEQGAGTVHWMDQDGNEHDIGEDGVFSEKIGYAIAAAQAKQGGA